jgi:hypothetical protein
MSGFDHALAKVLDAARGGLGAQSTGEQLMAALCLNRPDWLAEMGYTIAEALERVGGEWQSYVPAVSRRAREELAREADAGRRAEQVAAIAAFRSKLGAPAVDGAAEPAEPVSCCAELVSTGWESPGYRDTAMVFDLTPANSSQAMRVELRLSARHSEQVAEHLTRVIRQAWDREAHEPLDVQPGEARPRWL